MFLNDECRTKFNLNTSEDDVIIVTFCNINRKNVLKLENQKYNVFLFS